MRNRSQVAVLVTAIFGLLWSAAQPATQSKRVVGSRFRVEDVLSVMKGRDWGLVDTRPTDAYNGWALGGVQRGGHIPHAVDFPGSWLDVDTQQKTKKLADALCAKGIEPTKHVLLYSTNERDRNRVAAYLQESLFPHVYHFDFMEWIASESRPLVRYKNFHLLVPPSIVKQLLDGRWPQTFEPGKHVKFVEVSWGDENASYSKGHIPRSFHVNTDDFEPPPRWKLGSPEVLARFAAKYGFQSGDTVIISGQSPTASYRLAIVLRYMGVRDVRVLNGGFAAWQAAEYPIETKRNSPPRAASFGARIPARPRLIDSVAKVKAGFGQPREFTLVDNRTCAEFIGQTSGYRYHSHKGRIPNSVYGQADFRGTNSLVPYRNLDNTMRNGEEILRLWKKSGISTDTHLSFMCGSGWRAAEVLTFAHVIGLPKASLYSDGWIGWSNDQANPTESGPISKPPEVIKPVVNAAVRTGTLSAADD